MSDTVTVSHLPECDLHAISHPAKYDFRTPSGRWAYGCEDAFIEFDGKLGTGQGQRLEVKR